MGGDRHPLWTAGMNIEYTFEVASVDDSVHCMEIVYTSPGLPTHRISMLYPVKGQTLENAVHAQAPFWHWQELSREYEQVIVGVTGTVTPTPQDPTKIANAEMWAQVHFEQSVAKALIKFGLLDKDPTTIGVTTL
jgi:hypothetical protein